MRCLVRDPRRLGPERVRVQITIGDLTDPRALRQAMRGVRTVVHLAASHRDQPHATIEELAGVATWRLLRAAEHAGAGHFVFFSALGATPHHPSRLHRSKALAERAVGDAALRTTTFAPSLVYAPGDRRMARIERLAWLPAVPLAGRGRAQTQPIWAEDVADCVAGGAGAARGAGLALALRAGRAGRPDAARGRRDGPARRRPPPAPAAAARPAAAAVAARL